MTSHAQIRSRRPITPEIGCNSNEIRVIQLQRNFFRMILIQSFQLSLDGVSMRRMKA